MIRPTSRAVWLVAAGAPVALLAVVVSPALWPLWSLWNVIVFTLILRDAFAMLRPGQLAVRVETPGALHVGRATAVAVHLTPDETAPTTRVELLLDIDGEVAPPASVSAVLDGGPVTTPIDVLPLRRGAVHLTSLWLRWQGPTGLVARTRRLGPLGIVAPALPDVLTVREAGLAWMQSRSYIQGVRPRRYLGDGSEFDTHRPYEPGFDPRAIDWKVSARMRSLHVRQHRAERNHRVMLVVDTGRLMADPVHGLPRLDHAVNAGLLLAWLSLRTGDRVGLCSFDEAPGVYVDASGGLRTMDRLVGAAAGLAYTDTETNFTRGLLALDERLRRRSIVVILTDFQDSTTAELMVERVSAMARRHVLIFVAIRDPALRSGLDAPPASGQAINEALVLDDLDRERRTVLRRLERAGVRCVDAEPDDVSARLINHYLEIKRRGAV